MMRRLTTSKANSTESRRKGKQMSGDSNSKLKPESRREKPLLNSEMRSLKMKKLYPTSNGKLMER